MQIADITWRGLRAIAAAVLALWICLLSEGVFLRRASAERTETQRALRLLRSRRIAEPASQHNAPNPERVSRPRLG